MPLVSTLAGCGADQVVGLAHDTAYRNLQTDLVAALDCLETRVPSVQSAGSSAEIADELAPCVGTTFLDQPDDVVRTTAPVTSENGTVAVSSNVTDDGVVLELYTDGAGLAEAGVSRARALIATCWR